MSDTISMGEASQRLEVSKATLDKWIRAGCLPFLMTGTKRRLLADDVERFKTTALWQETKQRQHKPSRQPDEYERKRPTDGQLPLARHVGWFVMLSATTSPLGTGPV